MFSKIKSVSGTFFRLDFDYFSQAVAQSVQYYRHRTRCGQLPVLIALRLELAQRCGGGESSEGD